MNVPMLSPFGGFIASVVCAMFYALIAVRYADARWPCVVVAVSFVIAGGWLLRLYVGSHRMDA